MADRSPKAPPTRNKNGVELEYEKGGRPGAAMRALLDEQKRMGRKRLRIQILIGLALLLVIAYLAMTTFIFNPFEGEVLAFQNLVPRNCDFFARKLSLASDLPLPATTFTPGREDAPVWKALEAGWVGIPSGVTRGASDGVAQIQKALEGTPIDLVRDLVGREVCLAGRFPEKGGIEASQFGLYLRVGWRVRFAMGLLHYEYFRNKYLPNQRAEERAEGILKIQQNGRDLFLWKMRDLLLVSSDEPWIREASALLTEKGEGSFGQGATYTDDIQHLLRDRTGARPAAPSNVQFYVDVRNLRRALGKAKGWPEPTSAIFEERALASVFRSDIVHDVTGIVRFETEPRRRIAVDATFRTDTNNLDEFGKRIHQERATRKLGRKDVSLVGELTPQTSFATGAMVLAGGDIARQAEALLAIEDRRMMDDLVKRTGRYTTLRALADDFGIALGQRLIFVAHENNYPKEDKDPRDAFGPDPAVALIFPQQGPEKVRQLREYFLANKQQFGFPETYNYFLDPQKRYPLLEYYTPLMPGTGEIAVLQVGGDEKGEVVISNQAKLIKNVFQTWFDPGTSTSDRNYAEDPLYKDLLAEWLERKGNSYSHLFAFVNGPLALKALRNYVPTWAGEGSLFDPEKMRAERPAVFERILKSKYPNYTPQNVPQKERAEIDGLVDDEFSQRAATAKANISPKLAKEYESKIEWVSAVPGLFFSIDLDPKSAKLYLNIAVDTLAN
jgi:hypothetical protein